jgi:ketosteroid isomerase-like protein
MSQENVELVQRQHQAFNRGDVAGVLELLDADIEWWDRADDPGAGVHRGHDGVAEMLVELDDLAYLRVEAKEVLDAGDSSSSPFG